MVVLLLAAACGPSAVATPTATVQPGVASIEIQPRNVSLEAGGEQQFAATVRDAAGRVLDVPVQWAARSDDIPVSAEIGTITGAGKLAATTSRGARGTVIARAGGLEATASVFVLLSGPRTIDVVALSQAPALVRPGSAITVVAVARNESGAVVCPAVAWSLSPGNAGALRVTDGSGPIATFTASPTFTGTATVTVSNTAGPRGTLAITRTFDIDVDAQPTPPQPSLDPRRYISPQSATVAVGQQMAFAIGPSPVWAVCPDTLGTISTDGRFTAQRAGEGVVVSTVQGYTAAARVTVPAGPAAVPTSGPAAAPTDPACVGGGTAAPRPSGAPAPTIDPRPVVCPSTATLGVGERLRIVAFQQEGGRPVGSPKVTWSVSPSSIGRIDDDGTFTAVGSGTATITATLVNSPFTGTATVRVR